MEGSEDRFRDSWKPVPLRSKAYSEDSHMYTIEFEVPKQTLLLENFEALVHDELLRNAHRDGLVPIGQPFIETREKPRETPRPPQALEEGQKMTPDEWFRERMRRDREGMFAMLGDPMTVPMAIVKAEIMVGAALPDAIELEEGPTLDDLMHMEIPDDISEIEDL